MKCHESSRINTLMLHIWRICIAWQFRLAWPPTTCTDQEKTRKFYSVFRSLHPHISEESRQCQHAPAGAYPQRLSSENSPPSIWSPLPENTQKRILEIHWMCISFCGIASFFGFLRVSFRLKRLGKCMEAILVLLCWTK